MSYSYTDTQQKIIIVELNSLIWRRLTQSLNVSSGPTQALFWRVKLEFNDEETAPSGSFQRNGFQLPQEYLRTTIADYFIWERAQTTNEGWWNSL